MSYIWYILHGITTVDGRNPAPVDMVNIPLFTGFYTSQVAQDFFHQQYYSLLLVILAVSMTGFFTGFVWKMWPSEVIFLRGRLDHPERKTEKGRFNSYKSGILWFWWCCFCDHMTFPTRMDRHNNTRFPSVHPQYNYWALVYVYKAYLHMSTDLVLFSSILFASCLFQQLHGHSFSDQWFWSLYIRNKMQVHWLFPCFFFDCNYGGPAQHLGAWWPGSPMYCLIYHAYTFECTGAPRFSDFGWFGAALDFKLNPWFRDHP